MTKDTDLLKRLRMADEYLPLGHDGWEAADRIEALEAKLAKAVEAFGEIATDEHPLGWIAIAALKELKGDKP